MPKLILSLILISTLFGCATNPSFDKSRHNLLSQLNEKNVCCNNINEIPRKVIKKLPYKTSSWTQSDFEAIDENSPIFTFDNYKGYVMAVELPDLENEINFKIESISTIDSHTGGFFSPILRAYDSNFNEVAVYKEFKIGNVRLEKYLRLKKHIKYLIIHTSKQKLKETTTHPYTSVEGLYTFTSVLKKPHLPVGLFKFAITEVK